MFNRNALAATFVSTSLVLFAVPALGDRTAAGVHTLTVAEATALGYRDWTPEDDTRVVLYAKSEHVNRADLDLANPEHVAQLEARIKAAAVKACKAIGEAHAQAMPRTRDCAQEATRRTLARLQVVDGASQEVASLD